MNVTLIYVGVGVAGMSSKRYPGDLEGSWISHGVASIGACLKQAGHNVDLIDMRWLDGWADFAARIASHKADVYSLSVSAVDHHNALKAIVAIKRHAPHAKILVGGIHPTIFPQDYDFPAVDCVVTGEGEVTVTDLVRMIERGAAIPRLIQGEKPDLNAIPWVDRELFDYRNELQCRFAPDQALPSITMLAGRGCPFQCTYCQPAERAVFGHPYRMRSPENVVAELVALKERYSFRSITFWDDTFTFSPKWVNEFCDRYEAAGIGASIACCSRADIVCNNEPMIERLASIGVDWFVIGLESGSQRILDLIKKGCTVEQNYKAVEICNKNGIKVFGTFMLGLPTETNAEALATARMIDSMKLGLASPFYFLPIPGTDAHTYCVEHDLILQKEQTIERTGQRKRSIKGVDYDYLDRLMMGERYEHV